MITFKQTGNFNKTIRFLEKNKILQYKQILDRYAREGLMALKAATPVESGETATAWNYKITQTGTTIKITWTNSHVVDGVPIAILLQYGHATRNGGYVQGKDYINPALKPVFDKIAEEAWKEVVGV